MLEAKASQRKRGALWVSLNVKRERVLNGLWTEHEYRDLGIVDFPRKFHTCGALFEFRTDFAMLAAVKPITTAMIL